MIGTIPKCDITCHTARGQSADTFDIKEQILLSDNCCDWWCHGMWTH